MAALRDRFVNAQLAVAISSNGTNWAAWDVAYTAGVRLKRLAYLPYLQRDSAAWNELPTVNAALAGSPYSTPQERQYAPVEPGVSPGLDIGPPTETPPPALPGIPNPEPSVAPPYTSSVLNITTVEQPGIYADGFDNVRRYWKADLVYLHRIDLELINTLLDMEGDAPWQR